MRNKKIINRSIAIILIIITIIQLPTQVNTVLIPAIKDSPNPGALTWKHTGVFNSLDIYQWADPIVF